MPTQVNAHPASQHGIDPSAPPLSLRLLRLGLRTLRLVSERATVGVLTRLFVSPRRHAPPERERSVLARGRRTTLEVSRVRGDPHRLALWSFGAAEAPVALLTHGWEGRGSQLAAFVDPLVDAGFQVLLFDHVGHGASSGRRSSLLGMRDGLAAVVAHVGPERVRAVVAHSMGSVAVSLVLDRNEAWRAPRLVYVSPPYDMLMYFGQYLELVMGDQDLLPAMVERMERRYGVGLDEVHYDNVLPRRDEPLLVLHSRDDLDVPLASAGEVARRWSGATLELLDGLGHRRILRDPDVVATAVRFLREGPIPASPGPPDANPG